MSKGLNKLEKLAVFIVFLTLMGGLVGGAYFLTERESAPSVASAIQKPADITSPDPMPDDDVKSTADVLADRSSPSVPAFAAKRISSELSFAAPPPPPESFLQSALHVTEISLTTESPAPTLPPQAEPPRPEPVTVAVAKPPPAPAPAVITPPPAPATKPVELKPFVVNLRSSRVVHEAGGAWYELKLDRSEVESLRTSMTQFATSRKAEADEFDHLADAPAAPTQLAWWRPSELVDPNVISIGNENERLAWIAISRRTGRVFLHANQPIRFGN